MEFMWLKVFFLYFCYAFAENFESCHTPTGQDGACISIRKCGPLFAFVEQNTKSRAEIEFLRKSHCGFTEDQIPKVCCEGQYIPASLIEIPDDVIFPPSSIRILPNTSTCGAHFSPRIFGGVAVELDEFPWTVLIFIKSKYTLEGDLCGGALISERYILTAAHCVPKHGSSKIKAVRLGEYNKDSDDDCIRTKFETVCLPSPPKDVGVEKVIIHEKFNPIERKYDIALLRLKEDIVYTDYIRPICLPVTAEEKRKTYYGQNLTVAGWGKTENGTSSSIKLKVELPVVPYEECKELFSEVNKQISKNEICAGGQLNKDSCRGDSGSPLMVISIDEKGDSRWYAAGVVSWGTHKCGLEKWPGVYTKVSRYIGWILRHMEP
ncbi:hypothetical protein HHI36_000521 [Cryptolaemus montrouzieri]|uniref:CLIP domain-containing serine protease n=1 Tax=Cryptolaemus montrouzieri TaxID=559131 RepID=A0ABD2P5W0_9CUCU